ncbi:MAG TPA: trehalose-phosphatase [Planktothrix sp.]|jgi:trehalose 6-phosphate phosphatase
MRGEASFTSSAREPIDATVTALTQQLSSGGRMLLALDRDGTLIPIAERPEEAIADDEIRALLASLCQASRLTVAIVSARSKAQLMADFPGLDLIYAGNYGMEMDFPGRPQLTQKEAMQAVPRLKLVRDELASLTAPGIGAILEDHGLSICLHWHSVPADSRALVHDRLTALIAEHKDLTFKSLSTSYEVLPAFEWDKGKALGQIAETLATKFSSFAFFGDSAADEPAFKWVNDRQGVSVKIGSGGVSTSSNLQLPDTRAVRSTLARLAQIASQ